jgi:hypothetical protein
MFANVDRGLVLRDLDQPLGQIEHLPPLHAPLHRSRQPRAAMEARLRLMPHDPIGRLNLPERVALMSHLPAAFLARASAKAARDNLFVAYVDDSGRMHLHFVVPSSPNNIKKTAVMLHFA